MSNRYETIDDGYASVSLFESAGLVHEDEELQAPLEKRALMLGDPSNTALIVIGTNNALRTWVDYIRRSLGGE